MMLGLHEMTTLLRADLGKSGLDNEVHTEGEPWKASALGVMNAVLDTIYPGMRIAIVYDDDGAVSGMRLMQLVQPTVRPRIAENSLSELGRELDKFRAERGF